MDEDLRRYLEMKRNSLDQELVTATQARRWLLIAALLLMAALVVTATGALFFDTEPSVTTPLFAALAGALFAMAGAEERNLRRARKELEDLATLLPPANPS